MKYYVKSYKDTSSKEISYILRKCIEEVCIEAKNEKETWQSKTISPHVVIYGEIFHPLIEVYALYSDRKRFPNPFAITCEREGVSLYNFKEDFVIFIKNAIPTLVDIKEDVDISKYCRDVDTYRRGVKDALNFCIGKKNDKYNPFDRDIFNLNNYEYKNYFEISMKTDGILRQNNYFIKEQRTTLRDYKEVRTGRCGIRLFELYLKGDNSISAELKVDFSLHIF